MLPLTYYRSPPDTYDRTVYYNYYRIIALPLMLTTVPSTITIIALPLTLTTMEMTTNMTMHRHPTKPDMLWEVKKALYGAPQAGRRWFNHLAAYLRKIGYEQSNVDFCVFFLPNLGKEFPPLFVRNPISLPWIVLLRTDDMLDFCFFMSQHKELCRQLREAEFRPRARHIDVRHHFIAEQVREGKISSRQLASEKNKADILTKPLPALLHQRHTNSMTVLLSSFLRDDEDTVPIVKPIQRLGQQLPDFLQPPRRKRSKAKKVADESLPTL
eukprot:g9470.t1